MTLFEQGYALIIGIANYQQVSPLPDFVLKDANDFSSLLADASSCGYPPHQIKHLADDQATADHIREGLRWLAEQTTEDDTAIVFFSGHGGRIESGPQAGNYLIPVDANPRKLRETAIESAELTDLLRDIKAARLLVLFDCCHAGGTGEVKDLAKKALPSFKSGLDEKYYEKLARGQGRVIIASSRSSEVSWILPNWRNSLFTHYLLEAFRGKAYSSHTGQIGVLDVFTFVEKEVPKRKPQQQPILKADSATNFPIALYPSGKQHQYDFDEVMVENPKQLPLPDGAKSVLKKMFNDYQRVVIVSELGGGFSGSRIFVVRPILDDTTAELPTVVKFASVSLIDKELKAYQICIRHRLPDAAQIQGEAVSVPHSEWRGLRYALQGSGGTFEIESLYAYLCRVEIEDIRRVFERLFKRMERIWQQAVPRFECYLNASYERYLPVNLFIQIDDIPDGQAPHSLNPNSLKDETLRRGEYVRLEGFVASKIDLNCGTLDLNLPQLTNASPASYSIRLKTAGDMSAYRVGQVIRPIEGTLIETRQERLETEARKALGEAFDLSSETISWPDGPSLPNPLLTWPSILDKSRDLKTACIHGDLNLENILVNLESHDVSLIDFADARRDHVLHDFLRLETEVVTKIIPEILYEHHLPPQTIYEFYQRLHLAVAHPAQPAGPPNPALERPWAMLLAIREVAGNYLFKRNDWAEYYQGLAIYLLGAMKFGNLDKMEGFTLPLPKQVAFWGAATAMTEVLEAPPPTESEQKPIIPPDMYTPLERGAERLLKHIPYDSPYYVTVATQKRLLDENLKKVRQIFDTPVLKAERAEILIQLDIVSLSVIRKPFDQLCNY